MNMRCRSFRSAFLLSDGEDEADSHRAACEDCRAFVRVERSMNGVLKAHAPRWSASLELRERLAATVEQERERGRGRGRPRRRPIVAAAVAGIAAVAVGVWWWGGEPTGRQRAREMTGLVVEDFLTYAALGPDKKLQVASADAATVEAFFLEELRLAAKAPHFQRAELVGGRRCNLGGRPAALIFLERRGPGEPAPLSLFVFEPGGEDWSAMAEVPGRKGRRACHLSRRGVGVLVWEERGLVYALAGAEEIGELVSLVEGHL